MNTPEVMDDLEYELQLWMLSFEAESNQKQEDPLNVAQIISSAKQSNASDSEQELKELVNIMREPRKRLIIESADKENLRSTNQVSMNTISQQELPQQLPSPIRTSTKKLRMQRLKQTEEQRQDQCPICMNELEGFETICEIDPCKHQTCVDCIKEWAEKYKAQCPFCRGKFKNVWAINLKGSRYKRSQKPLNLDLHKPKWCQDFDEFYQDEDSDDDQSPCMVCQQTHSQYLMLICDQCNQNFCHTFCDPAIRDYYVPSDEWYCLQCRKSKFNFSQRKH